MFKVGDNVWTIQNGWEKVIEITTSDIYPVVTAGDNYTEEGRLYNGAKHPSLFSYDPLNGTEPPVEYVVGGFYKMKTRFEGDCFVAQCCDKDGVFEVAGWAYDLSELTDVVLMKEA